MCNKPYRNITLALLALLAGAILAGASMLTGCSGASGGIAIGADDDGGKVELALGQELVITLTSNPSTGYRWERVPSEDGVLVQVGEAEFSQRAKEKALVGAGGVETLRFEAKEAGQTTLELVYHRSWEKDADPERTFRVQVTVR
jgi:inhibitor of cysteine peptidase